jgi:hypothetical protein
MGRAQRKPHVRRGFSAAFLKVLPDFYRDNFGEKIGDADKPYLQEADRVDDIFSEPMDQGVHIHRMVA